MTDRPAMSVLLYVPGCRYGHIRVMMECLQAQTARDRLEIVLLASLTGQGLDVDERATKAFFGVRVVAVGEIESRAQAMAEGVRQASAPLVAFGGNHSYPAPDWAARLIEAHEGPWAAVAPSELNANPSTMISWAHFLIGHGRWIAPVDGGATDFVPMTNSAFKQSMLLNYGDELDQALERDGALAQQLRARGQRLFVEPDARIHHFNISLPSSFVRFRFHVGRAYAASRARREGWRAARRAAYAIGWPCIPFIQLRRTLGWMRRCDRTYRLIPRVLPAVMLGLVAHAVGEAIGYALGMGNSRQEILRFESDMAAHMTSEDRSMRAAGLVFGGRSA